MPKGKFGYRSKPSNSKQELFKSFLEYYYSLTDGRGRKTKKPKIKKNAQGKTKAETREDVGISVGLISDIRNGYTKKLSEDVTDKIFKFMVTLDPKDLVNQFFKEYSTIEDTTKDIKLTVKQLIEIKNHPENISKKDLDKIFEFVYG